MEQGPITVIEAMETTILQSQYQASKEMACSAAKKLKYYFNASPLYMVYNEGRI